jgi:hypothetical protein
MLFHDRRTGEVTEFSTVANKPGTEEHYGDGPTSIVDRVVRTTSGKNDRTDMKRYNQSRVAKGLKPEKVYAPKGK